MKYKLPKVRAQPSRRQRNKREIHELQLCQLDANMTLPRHNVDLWIFIVIKKDVLMQKILVTEADDFGYSPRSHSEWSPNFRVHCQRPSLFSFLAAVRVCHLLFFNTFLTDLLSKSRISFTYFAEKRNIIMDARFCDAMRSMSQVSSLVVPKGKTMLFFSGI